VSAIENRAAVNLAVVGGIYEAFGRGDIDFILDQIADDCAWESWLDNHGQKAGIPPMRPRYGREGVAEFFDYVATMQIQDFQVLDLLASDRQVVAEVGSRSPWRTPTRSPTRSSCFVPTRSLSETSQRRDTCFVGPSSHGLRTAAIGVI
jgi:SnoaL-like domain